MDEEEKILQNEDPEIIGNVFNKVIEILQLYGWFILFAVLVLLYIRSKVQPWLNKQAEQRDVASYKKIDAGAAQARLESMERSRLRMQAELDEVARRHAAVQKEKEEKKRLQRLDDLEKLSQGKGRSKPPTPSERSVSAQSSSSSQNKPKNTLRPAYNPLSGSSGGGACYRPSRRGGAGAGG